MFLFNVSNVSAECFGSVVSNIRTLNFKHLSVCLCDDTCRAREMGFMISFDLVVEEDSVR